MCKCINWVIVTNIGEYETLCLQFYNKLPAGRVNYVLRNKPGCEKNIFPCDAKHDSWKLNFYSHYSKFLKRLLIGSIIVLAARLPTLRNITLSAQTSSALSATCRALASLIEDLLKDGYNYVLTAPFLTDYLERRFSRYRQMSGGLFLLLCGKFSIRHNFFWQFPC